MAGIKVFISSTCYDLSMLRSELRDFIFSMGYEPVMSEYMDVLFDPRMHTHTSCIDEVSNCDMLVVVIGSRFGGEGVPEAVEKIDVSAIEQLSSGQLPSEKHLSITQLEVLKAIQDGIPVYTFIERNVYANHLVYEKNKNNPNLKDIVFPAIEKRESAEYIFAFIDFIRYQSKGNSIYPFDKIQDIENVLKKQWASYFQKMLAEQKFRNLEDKRMDLLSNQFEDLKEAILSSIDNDNRKEIARGVVRYRRLVEFLIALKFEMSSLVHFEGTLQELLNSIGIEKIMDAKALDLSRESRVFGKTILIKNDRSFFDCRVPIDLIKDLNYEWDSFKALSEKTKNIILETLYDTHRSSWYVIRYHSTPIDQFLIQSPESQQSDEQVTLKVLLDELSE